MIKKEILQEFFNSTEFIDYIKSFPHAYKKALEDTFHGKVPTDITTSEQWGEFYQRLWEVLPDSPRIRYGAFFRICDFAEDFCFGSSDEE